MSPTSDFGSNIFFNNIHSLGILIVSTAGIGAAATGVPVSPGRPTEPDIRGATTGETTGAAPRIGAVGTVWTVLMAGVPSEPVILQMKAEVRSAKPTRIIENKR